MLEASAVSWAAVSSTACPLTSGGVEAVAAVVTVTTWRPTGLQGVRGDVARHERGTLLGGTLSRPGSVVGALGVAQLHGHAERLHGPAELADELPDDRARVDARPVRQLHDAAGAFQDRAGQVGDPGGDAEGALVVVALLLVRGAVELPADVGQFRGGLVGAGVGQVDRG